MLTKKLWKLWMCLMFAKHEKKHRLHEIKTIWMQYHRALFALLASHDIHFHEDLSVLTKEETNKQRERKKFTRPKALILHTFFYIPRFYSIPFIHSFVPSENISNSIFFFWLSFRQRCASARI